MKEERPDGQGAAGPRYTSVRLDPKEVYLGGRRAVLTGVGRGEGGRFLTEADWEAYKSSRAVMFFYSGRVVAIGEQQPTRLMFQGEIGLRLSAP